MPNFITTNLLSKKEIMKELALLLTYCFVASLSNIQAQTINTEKSEVKFHTTGGGVFNTRFYFLC